MFVPMPYLKSIDNVQAVVTTRNGGVSIGPYRSLNLALHVGDDQSSVIENRTRVTDSLGVELEDLIFADQVHGTHAQVVGLKDRGRGTRSIEDAIEATDALVTVEPGVVLAILVADCVPILLVDPTARVLACVHAGWRASAARIIDVVLDTMVSLGAKPANVIASLGPRVSPDTYIVGAEVAESIEKSFGAAATTLMTQASENTPGHWFVDLGAMNRQAMIERGLIEDNIYSLDTPTGKAGPYFSDREERPCGRFGLFAQLVP